MQIICCNVFQTTEVARLLGVFTYALRFVPFPCHKEAACKRGRCEDGYKWQSRGEIIQRSWESTVGFTLSIVIFQPVCTLHVLYLHLYFQILYIQLPMLIRVYISFLHFGDFYKKCNPSVTVKQTMCYTLWLRYFWASLANTNHSTEWSIG